MSCAGRKRRKGFSGRGHRTGKATSSGEADSAAVPLPAPQQPSSAGNAAAQPVLPAPVLSDGNSSTDDDDFKQPPEGRHGSRAQPQLQQEPPLRCAKQGEQQPRPPRNYHEKKLAAKARQFEEAEAAFAMVRSQQQPQQAEQQQPSPHVPHQEVEPPQQQQQTIEPQHLRCGDAVEVMWKTVGSSCDSGGQVDELPLVPYHGIVTAVRQASAIVTAVRQACEP